MVLTRNSCISENYRTSKRILRDIKHQQNLRPRVSNPNYREESPDEISYYRNILKVDVNNKQKSLSHKLRIRSENREKTTYKEIHRYQLRAAPSSHDNNGNGTSNGGSAREQQAHSADDGDSVARVGASVASQRANASEEGAGDEGDMGTEHPPETAPKPAANKKPLFVKRGYKRRLSGTFTQHGNVGGGGDLGEGSQRCYNDNGRRYPVRLRRRPTDIYHTLSAAKKLSSRWQESLHSPPIRRFESRRRKFGLFSKPQRQSDSSDDDSDGDEARFEVRRQRSAQRALLELGGPVNMAGAEGVAMRGGVEPVVVDGSVTFESVGGNAGCVRALRESVVLPLVYPEVFARLGISAPRGLLFYGVPGSGKTLMARALVNEVSSSSGGACKVAFFMRKGADCLSKWVGESERQLRLLFEQAHRMRPSIIFFDEIDGLAPVRSARQDQIHASIVSTLLSLIDGLDDRGDVVVIGATNRLDAVDPALRRPGRFDREFLFALPEEDVRRDILRIHTRAWQRPPRDALVEQLAAATKGFSGADLRGLAVEAGLCALRRRYPQIYGTRKKLQLDLGEIYVKDEDFKSALKIIRPSIERTGTPIHCKIPPRVLLLIDHQYSSLQERVSSLFKESVFLKDSCAGQATSFSKLFKLHLLVIGYEVEFILSGLFHDIHNVTISSVDSLYLGTSNGLSAEEKLSHIFREAQKSPRSIVYIPNIDVLFHSLALGAQHLLLSTIRGTVPHADFCGNALLVLTTLSTVDTNNPWPEIEFDNSQSATVWHELGHCFHRDTFVVQAPSVDQRVAYFGQLAEALLAPAVLGTEATTCEGQAEEVLNEVEMKPKVLTQSELQKLEAEEDVVLRKFRILLRKILATLAKERKFQIFHNPVDESEVPDYYNIVTNPMDLSTMRQKVDLYNYYTFEEFKSDLDLISANALLYNPPRNSYLKDIRRHAYEFNDVADSVYEEHLNPEFRGAVRSIHECREARRFYEAKQRALAAQPGDALDFLAELNGAKHRMSSGPLLASQLAMFHRFYAKAVPRGREGGARAHSDSEAPGATTTTVARTTGAHRCKSVCDLSEADRGSDALRAVFDSFRSLVASSRRSPVYGLSQGRAAEVVAVVGASEDDAGQGEGGGGAREPREPPTVDAVECRAVLREAACAGTLRHLEGLYGLLAETIDRYRALTDRAALPADLRAAVAGYL